MHFLYFSMISVIDSWCLLTLQNIVADMRKVLAKSPQVEQQKLHRRVFLENVNPENQALTVRSKLLNIIFLTDWSCFLGELCFYYCHYILARHFSRWSNYIKFSLSVGMHFLFILTELVLWCLYKFASYKNLQFLLNIICWHCCHSATFGYPVHHGWEKQTF